MNRGRSLFGSAYDTKQNLIKDQIEQKQYSKIIQDLKYRPRKLKQFINQFRRAATQKDQHQVYGEFRKQQQSYKRYRQELKDQLEIVKGSNEVEEYQYVRNQLVLAIKQEMNLDLEMNQLIYQKKTQKEQNTLRWEKLQGRTTRVTNALQDIMQKAEQIKQLQASIKQCLNLLEIIGILVKQQGDKIQIVQQRVQQANHFIQMAQKNINIAKKRMQRSTRKKCCVILIGLVAICLILVVLYGINIIKV